MKHSSLGIWQRRLAKVSLVFVSFLLFEVYKDVLSNYANMSVSWMKGFRNKADDGQKGDIYKQKLNSIMANLQFLRQHGELAKIPGLLEGPEYALVGKEIDPGPGTSLAINGDTTVSEEAKLQLQSPKPCELGMQPFVDWKHEITPRFPLNSYKFLYPILKNEPIDQLIGLRQAIVLAIKLNRTLALPYFHNHIYGGSKTYNPPIPPSLKVNVDILRRFISVIPLSELQTKCNNKFDVALLTGHIDSPPGISNLLKAQSETQMEMFNTMNDTVEPEFSVKFTIPTFPKNLKPGEKVSLVPSRPNIIQVYSKESLPYKCAVHPHPLSALDVNLFLRKAIQLPNHKIEIDKMKNDILYSAVWYYTQPPTFIHHLAKEVFKDVMHAQETTDNVYNFLCLNYHKHTSENSNEEVDMTTLKQILDQRLKAMRAKSLKVSGVYISSPLSKQVKARDFRENLRLFSGRNTVPIFSGEDVIAKWRARYFSDGRNPPESLCSLLEDDTQDILSLVEMQVCIASAVFIRSIGSSWAANVQANRMKTKYSELDASIRELIVEVKGKQEAVT